MAGISEIVLSILIVIILLFSEVFLSVRKHSAWGLIPISLIALLMCCLWGYSIHEVNTYHNKTDTYVLNNGYSAEMTIKFNSENEVVAYSHIYIENEDGQLADVVPVEIVEEQIFCRCNDAAVYFAGKYNLLGYSNSNEHINEKNMELKGIAIRPYAFVLLAVILILPLAGIYVIGRRIMFKRRIYEENRIICLKSI